MPLKINITPALIGIETKNSSLEIRQPKADVNMKTEPLKMKIEKEDSKVQIDQSVCFSEANLKSIFELIKHSAQMGKQKSMEAIGRISSEGDAMMKIENGGNIIANMARRNSINEKNFDITFIPKSRPTITVTEPTLNIDFQGGKTNIDVNVNKVDIKYNPGKVDAYLRQKNSINIEYVNEEV